MLLLFQFASDKVHVDLQQAVGDLFLVYLREILTIEEKLQVIKTLKVMGNRNTLIEMCLDSVTREHFSTYLPAPMDKIFTLLFEEVEINLMSIDRLELL